MSGAKFDKLRKVRTSREPNKTQHFRIYSGANAEFAENAEHKKGENAKFVKNVKHKKELCFPLARVCRGVENVIECISRHFVRQADGVSIDI